MAIYCNQKKINLCPTRLFIRTECIWCLMQAIRNIRKINTSLGRLVQIKQPTMVKKIIWNSTNEQDVTKIVASCSFYLPTDHVFFLNFKHNMMGKVQRWIIPNTICHHYIKKTVLLMTCIVLHAYSFKHWSLLKWQSETSKYTLADHHVCTISSKKLLQLIKHPTLHHDIFKTNFSFHKIYNYFIELNSLKHQQQIQITPKVHQNITFIKIYIYI